MKEYPIGIPTNAWNAIRYTFISLALIPLAEHLWARSHAKRTGSRLRRGYVAWVRRSRNAHWGLHQEIDQNSIISRVTAIAVCVLHVAGALLLEFGSGSQEAYKWQGAVLSRSFRAEGHLRADGAYFIDSRYVLGRPYSSSECLDAGKRNLLDFAIGVRSVPKFTLKSLNDLNITSKRSVRIARYALAGSRENFEVYDDGMARWFESAGHVLAFVNKTITCLIHETSTYQCNEHGGNVNHSELVSDALAVSTWSRGNINWLWRKQNKILSVPLNRVVIFTTPSRADRRADAYEQTSWIRRGMPREETPLKTDLALKFNVNGLQDGCEHDSAIPLSSFPRLKGLKTSNLTLPRTKHSWSGGKNLIVWVNGNQTDVGTVTESGSEFCSSYDKNVYCLTTTNKTRHELASYWRKMHAGPIGFRFRGDYQKASNFIIEGLLHKSDVPDLVIQAQMESVRKNNFKEFLDFEDSQKRVVENIESGRIRLGLVRRAGNGIQGNSVRSKPEVATINPLFIAGMIILTLLVALPMLGLFAYRHEVEVDVENSYKRAVMEIHGAQGILQVPYSTPTIVRKELQDAMLLNTMHSLSRFVVHKTKRIEGNIVEGTLIVKCRRDT